MDFFRSIKARWLHVKSIGKPWWVVVAALWGVFWGADEIIAKWGSPDVKAIWESYTSRLHFDWRIGVIGFLVIFVLLFVEGSFRHHRLTIIANTKAQESDLQKMKSKIADLQQENAKYKSTPTLAEEDPKVYMEAMNDEFTKLGYVPFKFSNKGQRVNPAQGITVQPIKELPSIVFDYIDRIDATAEKPVSPNCKNLTFMSTHDILAELHDAWQEARQAGILEGAEFPFKVTIHYRDAKQHQFISEVSFEYSPLEEESARRNSLSSRPVESAIIRVTNPD